jgi:serine/threonine protein phosphatase PrpC
MLVHQISLQGKRPTNEDQHIVMENINGKNSQINNINLFAIFDGHGGPGVSKFMKDNIGRYFFSKKYEKLISDKKHFDKYINAVFMKLQSKLTKNHPIIAKKSGSTSLVVVQQVVKNELIIYLINLGDCRAVLCNQYNLPQQLTKDHKPYTLEERMRINKLGGKVVWDGYEWRVGNLSLSRAMGDVDTDPFVSHEPEIFKYKISSRDKYLVMACDGLWDVLSNQEVINFVNECLHIGIKPNGDNIAKMLADFAIRSGSTDNVTVLIQFIQPLKKHCNPD